MRCFMFSLVTLAAFGSVADAQYGRGIPSTWRHPLPAPHGGRPGPPAWAVYTYGVNPRGPMIDRTVRPIPGIEYYYGGGYAPTGMAQMEGYYPPEMVHSAEGVGYPTYRTYDPYAAYGGYGGYAAAVGTLGYGGANYAGFDDGFYGGAVPGIGGGFYGGGVMPGAGVYGGVPPGVGSLPYRGGYSGGFYGGAIPGAVPAPAAPVAPAMPYATGGGYYGGGPIYRRTY